MGRTYLLMLRLQFQQTPRHTMQKMGYGNKSKTERSEWYLKTKKPTAAIEHATMAQ